MSTAELAIESSQTQRLRRATLAVATLPALALLGAERFLFGDLGGFPLDDAWIHLQFARQLAAGAGLGFNPGELVAGTTAPLFTALVALCTALPGSIYLWVKLLGLAAHVVTLDLTFRLALRLDSSPRRAAVATLLVGTTDWLVWSVGSGMEIGLFNALVLAGLLRQIAERRARSGPPIAFLLFALAALVRPEGLLLLLLAALDRALVGTPDAGGWRIDANAWRLIGVGLLAAAILLVPVAILFAALSGSPWPTTLGAKAGGSELGVPQWRNLARVLELVFASQPLPTLLAAAGAVELARRAGGRRDAGLLLPLWTIALPLGSATLAGAGEMPMGNFGRYFFPLFPPLVLLALVGLSPLRFERVRGLALGERLRLPLGVVALLALLAVPLPRTARIVPLALLARENVEQSDRAAARWLAANAAPRALVAVCDIGLVKYELPNPILDLAGIAQPELQRYLTERAARDGSPWPDALLGWIERHRPAYVVVYPRWFSRLAAEPDRFPVLARFRIRDNVAMAGDELVVYATPWTREETTP